jgi:hypothetical protein
MNLATQFRLTAIELTGELKHGEMSGNSGEETRAINSADVES